MRRFKWIEWNISKIALHGLAADEVESAFDRVYTLTQRRDGSFEMFAEISSGRKVWVIWRYDKQDEEILDIFDEMEAIPIFVITAY